jgi:GDP-L-fucose synthase
MRKPRIFVAGHAGMVGSAVVRRLQVAGNCELILRTRGELDLLDQSSVRAFLQETRPDQVYIAAARVGGIHANNTYPADFIHDNLVIAGNLIHAAHLADVQQLLFLGSSCIYPRDAAQPLREDALLGGPLEPTNEPYAIAKIAGIKLCESYNRQHGRDYRSVMPTNLYGPHDNFHPDNSHVIPALLRRFHEAAQQGAEEVVIWGSGTPRREFLHVDDLAAACVHVMGVSAAEWQQQVRPQLSHVNVGTGLDCSIRELASLMAEVTGFRGRLRFDASKPDGTPRKVLDVALLQTLGWRAGIALDTGLRDTYAWFKANQGELRHGQA